MFVDKMALILCLLTLPSAWQLQLTWLFRPVKGQGPSAPDGGTDGCFSELVTDIEFHSAYGLEPTLKGNRLYSVNKIT